MSFPMSTRHRELHFVRVAAKTLSPKEARVLRSVSRLYKLVKNILFGLFKDNSFRGNSEMYLLTITTDTSTIHKEAKDEKELWRIINVYSVGSQLQKKKLYEQLTKEELTNTKKEKE